MLAQNQMTHQGAWTRGILYVAIAVLTELHPLLVSETGVNWGAATVRLFLVALITTRAYVDQSPSQVPNTDAPMEPTPVTVQNLPSQPVPTSETNSAAPVDDAPQQNENEHR